MSTLVTSYPIIVHIHNQAKKKKNQKDAQVNINTNKIINKNGNNIISWNKKIEADRQAPFQAVW